MNIEQRINIQRKLGMRLEHLSENILMRGFNGNGCGSGYFSQMITLLIMWLFRIRLCISCDWHDAGYSVSRSQKSADHKEKVDSDFQHNMQIEMKTAGVNPKLARWIAVRFRTAVLLKGDKAYWKGK